jgi:hypothetical protein
MGELVPGPRDKTIEGIFRIQRGGGAGATDSPFRGGFLGRGWGGGILLGNHEFNLHPGEEKLLEGRTEEFEVMFLEPLLEKSIGQQDLETIVVYVSQG